MSSQLHPIPISPPSPPRTVIPSQPFPTSAPRKQLILALRYVLSPKEYAALRKTLKFRAPPSIASAVPSRREFDAVVKQAARRNSSDRDPSVDKDDYDFLPSAIRTALRTFVGAKVGLDVWDVLGRAIAKKRGAV